MGPSIIWNLPYLSSFLKLCFSSLSHFYFVMKIYTYDYIKVCYCHTDHSHNWHHGIVKHICEFTNIPQSRHATCAINHVWLCCVIKCVVDHCCRLDLCLYGAIRREVLKSGPACHSSDVYDNFKLKQCSQLASYLVWPWRVKMASVKEAERSFWTLVNMWKAKKSASLTLKSVNGDLKVSFSVNLGQHDDTQPTHQKTQLPLKRGTSSSKQRRNRK